MCWSKIYKLLPAVCAACTLIFSGCAGITENTEVEKDNVAREKIGCALLDAFAGGNDKAFFSMLPEGAVKNYSRKTLDENRKTMKENFGAVKSYRFLGELESPAPLHTLVWAVRFQRAGYGKDELFQEVLFRVVLGAVDGENKVFAFGFL